MIIYDLNYLEITSEEVFGGYDFVATKNIAIVATLNETINVDKSVNSVATVKGNLANSESQATALGNNTLAETFGFTNTDSNSSAANSLSLSATND
ncbi:MULTISPECIES: hypothetical protein [unclassified Nostoc]|uniref:hypothetical protein n=1 Tax=unclassified Nostoc TaxID=2593658 RepID=UPI00263612D9|nr:hypothetical protein [Nostoc sp. S13]MDF5738400.1 hypothetical protein [Nostoc sp. S13]